MSSSILTAIIVLLPILLWLGLPRIRKRDVHSGAPYPPGPKGLPLVKNLFDMPVGDEKDVFTEWGKKYGQYRSSLLNGAVSLVTSVGPISHAEVLGEHIIILNTYDAVNDLIEKRSLIYSGRRESRMMNELLVS